MAQPIVSSVVTVAPLAQPTADGLVLPSTASPVSSTAGPSVAATATSSNTATNAPLSSSTDTTAPTVTAASPRPRALPTYDPRHWRVYPMDERALASELRNEALAQWRQHPRWNRTLARHFIEDVHNGFRVAFKQVVERSRQNNRTVDVSNFRRVTNHLEHHHNAEDEMFFPGIMQRNPSTRSQFQYLSLDHQHLHPLEVKIHQGDFEALEEFVSFLETHLNIEEMLLVPMMLSGNA
jgi:iron-sulfur cluster repair protein YtfE (RIC family)